MPVEPKDSLSLPNYPNKLPTNSEITEQGVKEFTRIARLLSPDALRAFASSIQIRRCFIGTSPEVGSTSRQLLPDASNQAVEEIRKSLTSEATNFLIVENEEAPFRFSVLNLLAAKQTIANYPLVFPTALSSDLPEWLQNSQNWVETREDKSSNIRLGLLSGFPYSAMQEYIEYHRIFSLLKGLNYFEDLFVSRYLVGEIKRDNQVKQTMFELAEHRTGSLSDSQKRIIAVACRQTSQAVGAFVSLGDPEDKAYVNKIDSLYRKSGIDLAAGKLLGKSPLKLAWYYFQTRVDGSFRE